jgi:LPXTG-motif cell wall-anchored protein
VDAASGLPAPQTGENVRDKISGAIGVIWGGIIMFRWFTGGVSHAGMGSTAFRDGYESGQSVAVVFGAILFLAGVYFLFRKKRVR